MRASTYQSGVAREDVDLMLTRVSAPVWEALRGQRIFITGGTGFVGCWLLEALLAAHEARGLGLALTVLSRDPQRFADKAPHLASHPALRMVAGDMRDLAHIDGPFDTIVHAATDVVQPAADPLAVFGAIVGGTEQVIALARRSGARRVLLASSGAVYGRQPPALPALAEDYAGAPATTEPASAYGQGKRVAEWLLSCAAREHGFEARIARCFAFVGPYMALDAQFAIGNFIRDAMAGQPVAVGGDGTACRSYLYAADLAVWLLTILVHGDAAPYNVGAATPISIGELARTVSVTLTGRENVRIAREPVPGAAPERYLPAVDRAAALGLDAFTRLPAAIARTAAWHRRLQEPT